MPSLLPAPLCSVDSLLPQPSDFGGSENDQVGAARQWAGTASNRQSRTKGMPICAVGTLNRMIIGVFGLGPARQSLSGC
jgi:hypothetical protein